jgi:hypothetical protein
MQKRAFTAAGTAHNEKDIAFGNVKGYIAHEHITAVAHLQIPDAQDWFHARHPGHCI